jgi:hypothetical protein
MTYVESITDVWEAFIVLIFWLANSAENGVINSLLEVCNNITSQEDVLCTNTLIEFEANITWTYKIPVLWQNIPLINSVV